jgi:hypothetical protein
VAGQGHSRDSRTNDVDNSSACGALCTIARGFVCLFVFFFKGNVFGHVEHRPASEFRKFSHDFLVRVMIFFNSNNYTIYPSDMDNKYIFCLIYNNDKIYITW